MRQQQSSWPKQASIVGSVALCGKWQYVPVIAVQLRLGLHDEARCACPVHACYAMFYYFFMQVQLSWCATWMVQLQMLL